MDDLLKSLPSEEDAVTMVKNLIAVCNRGGFKLTKWISNSWKVLQNIPEEHKPKNLYELDLDRDKLPIEGFRSAMVHRDRHFQIQTESQGVTPHQTWHVVHY